jgi:hypothetical protein
MQVLGKSPVIRYAAVGLLFAALLKYYGISTIDTLIVTSSMLVAHMLFDYFMSGGSLWGLVTLRPGKETSAQTCSCDDDEDDDGDDEVEGFDATDAADDDDDEQYAEAGAENPKMDNFGIIDDGEMRYTQSAPGSEKPLADRLRTMPRSVYGEVFVDPEAWYPPALRPPICVTNTTCPVQPIYINNDTMDLLQWDESRRITPPDNIHTQYVEEMLNSGRATPPPRKPVTKASAKASSTKAPAKAVAKKR